MDMKTGQMRYLPRAGGYLDQDEYIVNAMRHAWRAWYIWSISDDQRTDSDLEFMDWVAN
jgi:hypothetical protein